MDKTKQKIEKIVADYTDEDTSFTECEKEILNLLQEQAEKHIKLLKDNPMLFQWDNHESIEKLKEIIEVMKND